MLADLFGIIAPVFALIGLGAGTVRRGWVQPIAIRGMTDRVFYAAMPALLFRSVATAPALRLVDVAGSFIGGAILLFLCAVALGRGVMGMRLAKSSVFGLNCVFGNTVMLGIPIIDAAYGADGVANLLAVVAFHSGFLLPLATILIEADSGSGRGPVAVVRATLPGLLRNPVVMAIVLAFAWRATGLHLIEPVSRLLILIGAAGPPLALFCLGASLPKPSGGMAHLREVVICAVLKLVAMPAVIAVAAYMAGVTGTAFAVLVITAALPTGANAFLLARRFGTMAEESASAVVVTTILSVGTLTLLLGWLR